MADMYSLGTRVANGTLYVPTLYSGIWALEPLTGQVLWELPDEGAQSDLIYADGMLLMGTGQYRYLTGIEAETGTVRWRSSGLSGYSLSAADGLVFSIYTGDDPVISEEYPYSTYDRIAAFDIQTGTQAWETALEGETLEAFEEGMAVAGDVVLASAAQSKTVYVLDKATGRILTQRTFAIALRHFVVANGVLYACAYESGMLYALDPRTLEDIWMFDTERGSCGSLAVSSGMLYIGQGWAGVAAYTNQ
jgi:outer membrane protein assembly factor BamB